MNTEISSVRFMLAWLVAGIAALPAAIVLSVTAVALLQTPIAVIQDLARYDGLGVLSLIILALCLLIIGFCIGMLQKGVTRRYLGLEIRRLGLYSAFGSLPAGFAVFQLSDSFRSIGCCGAYGLDPTIRLGLLIAAFLGILSSIQTFALHPQFRRSRLWVLAHLGAIALASAIVFAGRLAFPTLFGIPIIHLLLAIPIVALLTGLVMRHLVLQQRRTDKDKRGAGPAQPAPASDGTPPTRSSVWDDAV